MWEGVGSGGAAKERRASGVKVDARGTESERLRKKEKERHVNKELCAEKRRADEKTAAENAERREGAGDRLSFPRAGDEGCCFVCRDACPLLQPASLFFFALSGFYSCTVAVEGEARVSNASSVWCVCVCATSR